MLRLSIAVMLVLAVGIAWATPTDDLRMCRDQLGLLTVQVQQAQNARTGYVAKLGEMLAETREQLDQERDKVRTLVQELQRLKVPKVEEKK